jgi:two-component system, NtrC family, nitrogen regulation sensor histidine kinase NtrY
VKGIINLKTKILIAALLLWLAGALLSYAPFFNHSPENLIENFTNTLHFKQQQLRKELSEYAASPGSHKESEFSFFVFEENKIVRASSNEVPLPNDFITDSLQPGIVKLLNGWYWAEKYQEENRTSVGFLKIKNEYPHQNQYISNAFAKDFELPENTIISAQELPNSIPYFNAEGDVLFHLLLPAENAESDQKNPLALMLFILGFLLLLGLVQKEIFNIKEEKKRILLFIAYAASLVVIRAIMLFLKFPEALYETEIFNPTHYASSELSPSLGDLLLNAIIVFYLIYLISRTKLQSLLPYLQKQKFAVGFAAAILIFLFAAQVVLWLIGIVMHSNIPFEFNRLTEVDYLSITSCFVAILLLFSFYILSDKLLSLLNKLNFSVSESVKAFFIPFVLFVVGIIYFTGSTAPLLYLWPLPVLFIIQRLRANFKNGYSFSGIILSVFVFSAFTSYLFSDYSSVREQENRKILIQKLAVERDPVAEYLYKETEELLSNDLQLPLMASKPETGKEAIEQYLRENYFSGYFGGFDLQATICTADENIFIAEEGNTENCSDFFGRMIESMGRKVNETSLYFLSNNSGRISYLAKVNFPLGNDSLLLHIELDSKYLPQQAGYPELLLDESAIIQSPELRNYSFAKYRNGRLVSKTGDYPYSVSQGFSSHHEEFSFSDKEKFNHLLFAPDENTAVILSMPALSWPEKITGFSYVFAFFSFAFLLFLLAKEAPAHQFKFNFKTRIQSILIGTVIISGLLYAAGTIYFIQEQYEEKNKKHLAEKIHSVLVEMEHKLSNENNLENGSVPYLTGLLMKFSNVFFSDINLFSPDGFLLATSQPEIFDKGLKGKLMEPAAFQNMVLNEKTEFIQTERIGKLDYISAYVPIYNLEGNLLAYLNLPYFSKQDEIEKEIASFLVAIVNIYSVLFILSVIIAVILSNFITGPLNLIRHKLSDVKLGKSNELIEWRGNDEIGSLIREYNRMIIELSESADRLAQSERESAWREMARQVAHEIKNPLTPMMLSVQHLERAAKDKAPDFDKKLERFNKTMIEQIETLSNIATEFSLLAKMPTVKFEPVNLNELINNVCGLFNIPGELRVSARLDEGLLVHADKGQLLRVFNNLIKNAAQAVAPGETGVVEITGKRKDGEIIISVKDNGSGIPEEMQHKIFTPNFTTKTSGSGLGLAIAKSIVEEAGGKISFNSQEGKGSEFNLVLPEKKAG